MDRRRRKRLRSSQILSSECHSRLVWPQDLIEALDSFTGKTIWLGFNGELDPHRVRANATDADIIVIMPIRL